MWVKSNPKGEENGVTPLRHIPAQPTKVIGGFPQPRPCRGRWVGIFGSSGCLLLHCRKKVLPRGHPVPPTALVQVPLKPLPQVLGKALSRPPGPGVPGGRVSPHVSMRRATCPLLWAAALELPSRVEYLSPQGVLLPLVYGTTASPLWLELRGLSARQATPSWTVHRLACHRMLAWLRVTFAMVSDAAWPGSDQWPWGTAPAAGPVGRLGRPSASDPWGVGSFLSLDHPTCARVCGVLGHLAPVHRCARSVRCVACAVSLATWLLFTGLWFVVLRLRCPGPRGSCSPVRPLGALLCVCGVVGHLDPVHRCACSVCCVPRAVSCATWLLFTGLPARCVALRVRCPRRLGSCSPGCGLLCCVCGVLGHVDPVHRCARSVRCFACAASWATWLPFTGVPARCVVLRVRCPGPLGCCSPVCPLGVLCCVCGVLGHLAPVHRCARSVRCPACAVSWATWLLFTGVSARCVVLRVRCLGPLGSCSRCARLVCCVACAVSWATWLLSTGVRAPSCAFCLCSVLGHLAPVHRCARSVCCVACAVSWATWLLSTGVRAPSCAFCLCSVLGHLAPVHRCARSVCCVACAVSWATWLLFTGVRAPSCALLLQCPGALGSCSPVCPLLPLL